MDRDELLELITTDDVIKILKDLGSESYKFDNNGNIYFLTICHGGNHYKLQYFVDSKMFMCYSCCGSMSLYDVIMTTKGITFNEAFNYVCEFKHISTNKKMRIGLKKIQIENKDLDFLHLHLYKKEKPLIKLPKYNEYILNIFDKYLPLSWYKEGITDIIADYFKIGFYISQNKATIPHYDINGSLVGIRARSFNQNEVENGRKYMPIIIQGLTYGYPMNYNLYGIYQNKDNIKRFKKAIIFESEKSVLKYGAYYGQQNNIALALCGMTFSLYQRNLLLSLGINEVIIALDKQYQLEIINDENIDKESKPWKEYEGYIKRLIKIAKMFMDYCNISITVCWDNKLEYKDAPIDKSKEVFEELYRERHLVDYNNIEELKELVE